MEIGPDNIRDFLQLWRQQPRWAFAASIRPPGNAFDASLQLPALHGSYSLGPEVSSPTLTRTPMEICYFIDTADPVIKKAMHGVARAMWQAEAGFAHGLKRRGAANTNTSSGLLASTEHAKRDASSGQGSF